MLTSIELTNFKNLRHQRIVLEPLTVFVGANSSGKTSVLEAIHLAVRAVAPTLKYPNGKLEKEFGWERHCDWLYTRGGTGDLSIACSTPGGTFTVSATPPIGFPFPQADQFGRGRWDFKKAPADHNAFESALKPARSMVFLHLNAKKLANATYSDRYPPRVEFDGEGVAPVLAHMALNNPDGFDALVAEMRQIIPHLKRIRFTKKPVRRTEKELVRFGDDTVQRQTHREYQGDAMLFDFQNANNVSAHNVSEGTLLLLGLLTVLRGPSPPDILLLDDIEHGLHPLAQKSLLEILARIMQQFPRLQILASAHSPYLLDSVRPEQVRLMTIGQDGYSVCGQLTDHPDFSKWKDEMLPGELWSLFGEHWLAQRVQAP